MTGQKLFADRVEAGRALATRLLGRHLADAVVLAMPRGGVPVAAEVAKALHAPLELVHVRKIGAPHEPELAVAAVVDGDTHEIVLNPAIMAQAHVSQDYVDRAARTELAEIARRRLLYGGRRPPLPLAGRTLVLVDDGIATGASVRAALQALRRKSPRRLLLAVPLAPQETIAELRPLVDEIICLETPQPFYAIGLHYGDFHQVSDAEVIGLLDDIRRLERRTRNGSRR